MPYTPPANRSPSSSAASSADVSRRSSFNDAKSLPFSLNASGGLPSPSLPRSSSYLRRHRRSPSGPTVVLTGQPTPQATSDGLAGLVSVGCPGREAPNANHTSIRQSPPPVTGDRRGMPTGAVISPPDSPPSSDDEDLRANVRGRQLESTPELKQLKEAISQLPRPRRASSPSDDTDATAAAMGPSSSPAATNGGSILAVPSLLPDASFDSMGHSFSTGSLDRLSRIGAMAGGRSISSHSGRRVSHVRSATEPSVPATPSGVSSLTGSDDENNLDRPQKPQMVRKKSGELVRPALRLGSRRRPSSMPGTPTFSKAVHFDSHLEHVRHFLQVDRPLAVSVGSSPVDLYESESEYPFHAGSQSHKASPEWEIVLTKFPVDTPDRKAQPVRLERVWLSADQKFLHGSVAVLNLAFAKSVVCRFTLDYWKTTSEIAAEYSAEILPRTAPQGHDRFIFTIKLSDLANLESKTLYFCIRYNVGDQVFWDNNNSSNFQLDFKKKMPPAKGLQGSALPRSNSRRQNPSTAPRPRSMPVSLDDFDDNGNVVFGQSIHEYLGESVPSLRLKSSQSASALPSDNLTSRLVSPSGQAFANRYDFGASLTAAMLAAKDTMANKYDDGLYMTSGRKSPAAGARPSAAAAKASSTARPAIAVNTAQEPDTLVVPLAGLDRDTRAILVDSGSLNGPGSIASKSYEEIVSKYCFYVPKQPNQAKDGTLQIGQIDGSVGELVLQNHPSPASSSSTISSDGSPVHMWPGGYGFQPQQAAHDHLWFQAPERRSSESTIRGLAHGSPSGSTITSSRSASPATTPSLVDSFSPLAGSPASDYRFQHMAERFPFNNADTHSTTPIQG